jgi:phospholipase/carboxylesterase
LCDGARVTACPRIGYPNKVVSKFAESEPPMLMTLSGPSRAPFTGDKPDHLVILLHGRGSDGEEFLDLQRFWGRMVPQAEFIAPNAPFPSDMAARGFEWFRAQDRSPASILAAMRDSAQNVDAFISEELRTRGLSESEAMLVGFSQGTMMALHVGLRRERPLAGIIGYSGRLVGAQLLAEELRSRPPVLLVHGTNDERVPLQTMTEAETVLRAAGVPVETLACVGTDHSIDEEGLVRGGIFLHQAFSAPGH